MDSGSIDRLGEGVEKRRILLCVSNLIKEKDGELAKLLSDCVFEFTSGGLSDALWSRTCKLRSEIETLCNVKSFLLHVD